MTACFLAFGVLVCYEHPSELHSPYYGATVRVELVRCSSVSIHGVREIYRDSDRQAD